jgi:hypothetical protein
MSDERPVGETPFNQGAPPIWAVIADLGKTVSEEEWTKVPPDLAANLGHYLYGEPKKGARKGKAERDKAMEAAKAEAEAAKAEI